MNRTSLKVPFEMISLMYTVQYMLMFCLRITLEQCACFLEAENMGNFS